LVGHQSGADHSRTPHNGTHDHSNIIHICRFGKVCGTLGPWEIDINGGILDTISTLMRHPWFYGYLTKDTAYQWLKDKSPGTFLIRFGTSQNRFVVSRVLQVNSSIRGRANEIEKKVVHNRINFDENGFSLPGRAKFWRSIEELVEGEKLVLKTPYKPDHPLQDNEDTIFSDQLAVNTNYYEAEPSELSDLFDMRRQYIAEKEKKNKDSFSEMPVANGMKHGSSGSDSESSFDSCSNSSFDEPEILPSPRIRLGSNGSKTSSNGSPKNKKKDDPYPESSTSLSASTGNGKDPKLAQEIEDLEKEKDALLHDASQGIGGEAIFGKIGQIQVKIEILKKKLNAT